ncbi:MAG: P-loop NTPase [Planctomycetota bacterium]
MSGLVVAPPYLTFKKKLRSLTSEPVLRRAAALIAGESDFETLIAQKAPLSDVIATGRAAVRKRLGEPCDLNQLFRELRGNTWTRHPYRRQVAEIYSRAPTPAEARLYSSAVAEAAHQHHRERARRTARRLGEELAPRIEAVRSEYEELAPALQETVHLRWAVPSLLTARHKLAQEKLEGEKQYRRNEFLLQQAESPAYVPPSSAYEEATEVVLAAERQELVDLSERLEEQHPFLLAQRRRVQLLENYVLGLREARRSERRGKTVQELRREQQKIEAHKAYAVEREQELSTALLDATAARGAVQTKQNALNTARMNLRELLTWEQYLRDYDVKQTGAVIPYSFATHAEAVTPAKPRWGMLLSLACAILTALTVALVLEHADRRVHGARDVHGQLGVPLLGVIPDGSHEVRESIEALATTLQTQLQQGPRSLVICSARPGEGKTTVTATLACSLANRGKQVVIVDANPHDSRITKALMTCGVSTLSEGNSTADPSPPEGQPQATSEPNLSVVTSGPSPAGVPSQSLRDVIDCLQPHFDYVLIDTPPLDLFGDALGGGAEIGGALLVVSAKKTQQAEVAEAQRQLELTGSPIIGVVLNRFRSNPALVMQGNVARPMSWESAMT